MNSRFLPILTIQLLAAFILIPATGESVEILASLPIEEVVVYPDRALIVRSGIVRLPAGVGSVLLEDLPPFLDRNSLRASGEGAGCILGVDLLDRFDSPRLEGERKELTQNIESLQGEIDRQEDLLSIVESQRELLFSLKDLGSSRLVDDAARGELSPAEWPVLINLFGTEMQKLTLQQRESSDERDRLVEKRDNLQRTLAQLGADGSCRTLAARVELDADRAGSFDLKVSYVVQNCGWQPLYDIRLDQNLAEVDLTQYAQITQSTGERWEDVKLSLSTARPAIGATAPELLPWYIDYRELQRPGSDRLLGFLAEESTLYEKESTTPSTLHKGEKKQLNRPMANEITHLTSMVFEIDRPVTLESRRPPHRVTVATHRMETTLEHYAVPKLMETVFLNGNVVNGSSTTLLPGEVSIFLEANYVGKSFFRNLVSPGESFPVSFGADEGIEVKRERVKREADPGFKNVKETCRYRIEMTNYKKAPSVLVLLDQLPVSRQDEIDVDLRQVTVELTGDPRDDEKGILRWELSLDPGESKTVEFEFRVNHPKGISLAGL